MHNLTPTDMDPSVERRRDEQRERGVRWMERERKALLFVSMSPFYLIIFLDVKFKTKRIQVVFVI